MASFMMELTELAQIKNVTEKIRQKLAVLNIPQEVLLDIQLAVTEVVGNAFLHGTKGLHNPKVKIEWSINNNSISIRIKDNGSGFNYKSLGTLEDNDILAEKGKGLFLVSKVLDELLFNEKGNEIYCLKKW